MLKWLSAFCVLNSVAAAVPSPPPPPAPPCTVEMLKQRPAGDKSWPVACSQTTLGTHEHRAWAALLTGNSENMTTLALVQVASLRRFSAYKQ